MDWSKSKSILIIVLLVFCLALSSILAIRQLQDVTAARKSNVEAKEYLESMGVVFECDIPTKRPSLEVLFVEYNEAPAEKGELTYKKYQVYTNSDTSAGYTISSKGEEKAQVSSASSALINAMTRSSAEKQIVYGITLCYYINNNKIVENGSMDTAVPAWRIETNEGVTFILAY